MEGLNPTSPTNNPVKLEALPMAGNDAGAQHATESGRRAFNEVFDLARQTRLSARVEVAATTAERRAEVEVEVAAASQPAAPADKPNPDRSIAKNDGSLLQLKDGEAVKLTNMKGATTEFQREDGKLTKIVFDGNKRVIACQDGKWTMTERQSDGKETVTELAGPPKVSDNGEYSVQLEKGGTRLYKTNGSIIHTKADGNVSRIDFSDGTFRTIEWKGEGKAAKESVIRTYRADNSLAEQLQLNDQGTFEKFTWAVGAKPENFFRGLQLEAFKVYPNGECFIKNKYDYRPSYEQTDRSKIQYERVELEGGKELWRPKQITYANGESREFGYFGKTLDLNFIKIPGGTEFTRTTADTNTWTYPWNNGYSSGRNSLNMTARMAEDNTYSYQETGKEIVVVTGTGKLIHELPGGGREFGNEKRLVYSPSGRIIELDEKKNPVKIIEANGGPVWSLSDKAKSEWTSSSGEKRILTVKDGQYSYTDEPKRKHTFNLSGREVIENKAERTTTESRGVLITKFTGPDGKPISFDYGRDGLSGITDAHGSQWLRKTGSDEWTVTRGGKTETISGRVTIATDGSYTFSGTGANAGLEIASRADGTVIRSLGNETSYINSEGLTVKVESDGEGDKKAPLRITKYDSKGVELFTIQREKTDNDKFNTAWKSEKFGEFKADLSVSGQADLLFRTKNADGSILEKDDRANTRGILYPNGDKRSFVVGKDGQVLEVSFLASGAKAPVVWKREGTTDWWISNKGEVDQRANVQAKDGVFSYRSNQGDISIKTTGITEVKKDGVPAISENLARQREQLQELARARITSKTDLDTFEKNLETFVKRTQTQNLPEQEAARTLNECCRMIVHPSEVHTSAEHRLQSAKEAMRIAADVISVDQGYHPTCNVTNDEVVMYWRHPSKALKFLADVSTTGEFKTKDNSIVKIDRDSLLPDSESKHHPTRERERSLASQWFQVACVNVHWQRQNKLPDGTATEKGMIVYRQTRGEKAFVGDSLERLIDTKSNTTVMDIDKLGVRRPDNSPHMSLDRMADAYEQIAGEIPKGFAIRNSSHGASNDKGIIAIGNGGELHKLLTEMKTKKTLDGKPIEAPLDFPIIIQVHSLRRPFSGNADMGGSGGVEGAYHVVTIWDYNHTTGEVYFKNQWGRDKDHLGRNGGQHPVHVTVMADATTKPPPPPPPPKPVTPPAKK